MRARGDDGETEAMMNSETQDTNSGHDESSSADEGSEAGRTGTAREWLGQLQAMIDNVATAAAPVMRQVAAKAAELAAVAGEKAGPIAHRAAEVTAQAGMKVAERGREVAAELRMDMEHAGADAPSAEGSSQHESAGPSETREPGTNPDTSSGQ
jgi:hypothetical protein